MEKTTIYGTCYNLEGEATKRYLFYAEIKPGEQNVDENFTAVTVALKVCRNPEYAYAASAYNLTDAVQVKLAIDGTEVYSTEKADIDTRNAKVWTFTTQTVNVAHEADGTKVLAVTASFSGADVSSLDSGVLEGEVALAEIPRSSAIVSADSVTLGKACSIKWVPASVDFRYRLEFSLGDWSDTTAVIYPKQTTAYTYTGYIIPVEVAQQISGANSAAMTVKLYTYSDGEATVQVGTAERTTFAVVVPNSSDTMPTVRMELSPVHGLPGGFDGLYIQGKSKVQAALTAEGKYGANIAQLRMKVDGVTYGEDQALMSDYLAKYGRLAVYGYAEDDRGITGGAKAYISVIAYSKPKILPASGESNVVAARCDAEGNLSDGGNYLFIKAKRSYSPVEAAGQQKNFCAIRYRYRADGGSYSPWDTVLASDSLDSDEVATGPLLGGALDSKTSYLVQVQAIDDIGESAITTITVPTETVHTHRTKNAMGLGKYVEEENLLDVAWNAHFRGEVKIGETGMTLKEYILAVISEGG